VGPAIYSSLTDRESAWLVQNARGRCLEVGSAFGYSTVCIALQARSVISVDPHIVHASYNDCLTNLKAYGLDEKVAMLCGPSRMVLPMFTDGHFDFAFIDGSHEYEDVKFDIEEAFRVVKPKGLIGIHDYGEDSCPGVKRAIDERDLRPYLELIGSIVVYERP
jgi:predicted O-methyltransferase YrrM